MPPKAALTGTPAKKTPKPIFKTDIAFSATKWPQVAPDDHDIILDMLCNLLEPLGQHRKAHIRPSQGRSRNRKRKRTASTPPAAPPPVPSISLHLTVGLNSTTRHLESLAALSTPRSLKSGTGTESEADASDGPMIEIASNDAPRQPSENQSSSSSPTPLSLIVLPHPSPSSSLVHAHIPTLVYLSSLTPAPRNDNTSPRLVLLSSSSESRLANALHLPRVGAVGVMEGAPGAETLVQYVRDRVEKVKVEWLEEARRAEWKGVKIVST